MTPAEHYTEAERLLEHANGNGTPRGLHIPTERATRYLAEAAVHAALASAPTPAAHTIPNTLQAWLAQGKRTGHITDEDILAAYGLRHTHA